MTREPLPNRRSGDAITFEHSNVRWRGMVSLYADGRPAEVFLEGGKVGSPLQAMARDAAVLASLCLQHGVSIETIRNSVTRLEMKKDEAGNPVNGDPAGPIGALFDKAVEAAA